MLVSDSHKLVFVHIQKTGGSTVHRLLLKRIPDIRPIVARHSFASRGMEEIDDWNEHFTFAFVRNPWDRLVSWYSMVTAYPKIPKTGSELWRYARSRSSTFEEFIYTCTDEIEIDEGVYYSFAYNQLEYITDESGNLVVDFVGRFENFVEDLQKVFGRIGVGLETVPHENRSQHRHYSTFYTPETEMVVRERFKRDIEYFGYEFERPHTLQDAALAGRPFVNSRQGARRSVEVDSVPKEAGSYTGAVREPKDEPPRRPGRLFVCGCDASGTTLLTDYLNRYPEILVCQGDIGTTKRRESIPDLSSLERMLISDLEGTKNSTFDGDEDRLRERLVEISSHKDPAKLRWIGASNPDYVRHMVSIAGNNPGARFMVVYRPIEEIAESWEARDASGHLRSGERFEEVVNAWNRSLQSARRFIRDSQIPRVLLVSYHDYLYRTETVVPLISRFLELELDESVVAVQVDEALQSRSGKQPEEMLGREKRSLVKANRAVEAWILNRIDKQRKRPELYTQTISETTLATYLDEMEAKTWRLQQKVDELERSRKRARQRFKQLESSRTWKLAHKLSDIRARIAGR